MLNRQAPHAIFALVAVAAGLALAAIVNEAGGPAWLAGLLFVVAAAAAWIKANATPRAGSWQGGDRRQAVLAEHAERLRILHEIDRAILAGEPPEAIAGRVIESLRELLGVPRIVVNLFDLAAGKVEWLAAAGRKRVHVGPGVSYSLELMGDIDALARGEMQRIETRKLEPGPEVDALLASGVEEYMVIPMLSGRELIGAISFGGRNGAHFSRAKIRIAEEFAMQLAIAMSQTRLRERIRRHSEELESRVRERTRELEELNRELETFSYSVSHDLRAPLRHIDALIEPLLRAGRERLDVEGTDRLERVLDYSGRMVHLIDDLMQLARANRGELKRESVDLSRLAHGIISQLRNSDPGRRVDVSIQEGMTTQADRGLVRIVLENLLGNAWKYTSRAPSARITFESHPGGKAFFVRDNGAGFEMKYADKLFQPFHRLHHESEFQGTGIGLATVHRIITRHGGTIAATGKAGAGAEVTFTLGQAP